MTRLVCIFMAFVLTAFAVPLRAAEVLMGAAQTSQPPTHPPRVMILPFNAVGPAGANDWIGTGIQQSLQAEAAKDGKVQVISPATQPANAEVNPMMQAAQAGASIAVVGGFQVVNGEVRTTGAVVDTATGKPLGVLAATGPMNDLFKEEDALGAQMQQTLSQVIAADATTTAPPGDAASTQPATAAVTTSYPQPTIIYPSSYDSSSYSASYPPAVYNNYYYPSYSYPPSYYSNNWWPGYWGGFFWFSPIVVCNNRCFVHNGQFFGNPHFAHGGGFVRFSNGHVAVFASSGGAGFQFHGGATFNGALDRGAANGGRAPMMAAGSQGMFRASPGFSRGGGQMAAPAGQAAFGGGFSSAFGGGRGGGGFGGHR